MTQVSALQKPEGFGVTDRHDAWWIGPALTLVGLSAFLIYGTWAAWQDGDFEIRQQKGHASFHANLPDGSANKAVAPYLSPFYAPLIYDPSPECHHAWIKRDIRPTWLPSWAPFSAGFLILAFPGLFRFTCYYYRKAYYRAFWADPVACGVGEPRKSYWGENRLPLILQNLHRYLMYFALIFLALLWWDALCALWWHTDRDGKFLEGIGRPGVGVGTLIMLANVVLLSGFTFGCNSVRHLVGGRLNCFSCPKNPEKVNTAYKLWQWSTLFNERHMEWAWASLFSVGFTDVYIRMCSLGVWTDLRLI